MCDQCIIISHTSTAIFNRTGGVVERHTRQPRPRFPEAVYDFMRAYIADHPCFFLEELQDALRMAFPDLANTSVPTICRALRHDLNLTRKRIQKRAREALPGEVADFKTRLKTFYCYPEQLVFIDETSKDGRSALRRYAWSTRGTPAIVELPFSRGKRVSALAAFNSKGFLAWQFTTGTFTRHSFHDAVVNKILPHLMPWPLPNSIVIIDNARIHMYKEFQDAIESRGAMLYFLPPYSPQLNPIEVGFSLVKRWIEKNANLAFHHEPEAVLDLAFRSCANRDSVAVNLFSHCGYDRDGLRDEMFDVKE